MLYKAEGILRFNPENVSKKHIKQDWKKVAIIETKCDIENLYSWFLFKRFNLKLGRTIRGTHVTIISEIMDDDIFEKASDLFNGKKITFYYEVEPSTNNGKFWWLRVYCPDAEVIRKSMGLNEYPYFGFHLTIGVSNDSCAIDSEYISRVIKMYNMGAQERLPFNEHEIVNK